MNEKVQIFSINRKFIESSKKLEDIAYDKLENLGIECEYIPSILFCNLDNDSRLGFFDIDQNAIFLADYLVQCGSEGPLIGIFLHELAHFVEYYITGDTGHDSLFRNYCRLLGADEEYSAAKVKSQCSGSIKIRSKVEKLLNLSASDFEGEASSALKKAQDLMIQYNLGYISNDDQDELFGFCALCAPRINGWESRLGVLISKLTGCFCVKVQGYPTRLEMYGSIEQIESSVYLWQQLNISISREAASIMFTMPLYQRRNTLAVKNGIVMGMLSQVNIKNTQANAIIIASEKNQNIYSSLHDTRIRTKRSSISANSQYMEGFKKGQSMDIPDGRGYRVKRITES